MGYINVYYSILYRVDYYEIFPQNLKIKGKKKRVVFILLECGWPVSFNFFPSNSVFPTFKD